MSTHGARKGLTDTALGTAQAGYLTRRLFDVAQDSIVTENDCGTKRGITINRIAPRASRSTYAEHSWPLLAEAAVDSAALQSFKKGHYLSAEDATRSMHQMWQSVVVRSPMSCETRYGICQNCYGMDLTTQELVDLGEAVGTIAAQAIGEPGTQLTMRTFHAGGVASVGGDITQRSAARRRSLREALTEESCRHLQV